jgi:flagellar biosynthesis/type III secretory pathway protein FliH
MNKDDKEFLSGFSYARPLEWTEWYRDNAQGIVNAMVASDIDVIEEIIASAYSEGFSKGWEEGLHEGIMTG